jgi:hypothetical protein
VTLLIGVRAMPTFASMVVMLGCTNHTPVVPSPLPSVFDVRAGVVRALDDVGAFSDPEVRVRARAALQLGADRGDPEARLGLALLRPRAEIMRDATPLGFAARGFVLRWGVGGPRHPADANAAFARGAELGDPVAELEHALVLYATDRDAALALARRAARKHHVGALEQVATWGANADSLPVLREAIALGSTNAVASLAVDGDVNALVLLDRAAELGNPRALRLRARKSTDRKRKRDDLDRSVALGDLIGAVDLATILIEDGEIARAVELLDLLPIGVGSSLLDKLRPASTDLAATYQLPADSTKLLVDYQDLRVGLPPVEVTMPAAIAGTDPPRIMRDGAVLGPFVEAGLVRVYTNSRATNAAPARSILFHATDHIRMHARALARLEMEHPTEPWLTESIKSLKNVHRIRLLSGFYASSDPPDDYALYSYSNGPFMHTREIVLGTIESERGISDSARSFDDIRHEVTHQIDNAVAYRLWTQRKATRMSRALYEFRADQATLWAAMISPTTKELFARIARGDRDFQARFAEHDGWVIHGTPSVRLWEDDVVLDPTQTDPYVMSAVLMGAIFDIAHRALDRYLAAHPGSDREVAYRLVGDEIGRMGFEALLRMPLDGPGDARTFSSYGRALVASAKTYETALGIGLDDIIREELARRHVGFGSEPGADELPAGGAFFAPN